MSRTDSDKVYASSSSCFTVEWTYSLEGSYQITIRFPNVVEEKLTRDNFPNKSSIWQLKEHNCTRADLAVDRNAAFPSGFLRWTVTENACKEQRTRQFHHTLKRIIIPQWLRLKERISDVHFSTRRSDGEMATRRIANFTDSLWLLEEMRLQTSIKCLGNCCLSVG